MRRFYLQRTKDISGVSGTGKIAEGVEYEDGVVAMQWLSHKPSLGIYRNVKHLRDIHGHEGATRIVWVDPDPLEEQLKEEHGRRSGDKKVAKTRKRGRMKR